MITIYNFSKRIRNSICLSINTLNCSHYQSIKLQFSLSIILLIFAPKFSLQNLPQFFNFSLFSFSVGPTSVYFCEV